MRQSMKLMLAFLSGIGFLLVLGLTSAENEQTLSPVKAVPNRDAYFPNTEDLGPNEMRIISLGTAMPFQRPAQAALYPSLTRR